jgi:hypothetical protein
MKRIYILTVVLGFAFFGMQSSYAQTDSIEKNTVYKTTKTKTPEKVKETLKDYSGYKIENEVTYFKKSSGNVYKFKVTKGNWSHFILIDEKGRMKGIETGEH